MSLSATIENPDDKTLCIVCNERARLGALRRCKACLQANAAAEREAREMVRARRDPLFPNVESTALKICKTCSSAKPVDDFDRDPVAADGRRRSCRECISTGACAPISKSPTTRAKDSKKAKEPHRRAANLAAVRRWQANNARAKYAAVRVYEALKAGTLARPSRCQINGCTYAGTRLQAHHGDYEHPLFVLWLCRAHHRELHNGRPLKLIAGLPPELAVVPDELVRVTDPEAAATPDWECVA